MAESGEKAGVRGCMTNRPEACGLRHLSFRVDDIDTSVRELQELGIECEPVSSSNGRPSRSKKKVILL